MTASAADLAAAGVAVLHGRLGTHVAIDALNVLAARAEAAEARVAELEQTLREIDDPNHGLADDFANDIIRDSR